MTSTEQRTLILAGREFKLSYLPFAKNRIVVNAASIGLDAVNKSTKAGEPLRLTDIDYIYLAVYEAVSHADKSITREQFNEWGMSLPELVNALMVVALQTGVLVQASDKGPASKEAPAA